MRPEVQPHPTCPVFGEFDPSAHYAHRAGVYDLALDDRRNLVAIPAPRRLVWLPVAEAARRRCRLGQARIVGEVLKWNGPVGPN